MSRPTKGEKMFVTPSTFFLDTLPPLIKSVLVRCNMTTPEDVVVASEEKLKLEGCTEHDVRKLKEAAAKLIAQSTMPASQLLRPLWCTKWLRLSYGCSELDRCSGGGVVTRGITEICGAPGSGKTQLLLQLSLTVQLPIELGGCGKGVAYISTEGKFPSKRLQQMAKHFAVRYPNQQINLLGNIYVDHAHEVDELLHCVSVGLANLLQKAPIGLIIIDSVAAVFRIHPDFFQRARQLRKMAHELLYYADKYNCAIVCVNQMVAVVDDRDQTREVPCLGLTWSHLGRTRIKLSKIPKEIKMSDRLLTVRKFEIMYAPETPNEFCEFLITEQGIVNVK